MLGRRRRKKCDETKPVCGRCRRDPVGRCDWEAKSPQRSSSPEEIESLPATILQGPRVGLATYLAQANTLQMQQTSDEHHRELELLLITFNNVHSMSYMDPDLSQISLGFSCVIRRPGLMHAYAACGAAILSGSDSRWDQVGLAHHVRATNLISTALNDPDDQAVVKDDWLLASVNALHIFEVNISSSMNILEIESLTVVKHTDTTKGRTSSEHLTPSRSQTPMLSESRPWCAGDVVWTGHHPRDHLPVGHLQHVRSLLFRSRSITP